MIRAAPLLCLLVALAACGRYGPPVRASLPPREREPQTTCENPPCPVPPDQADQPPEVP